MFKKLLVALDGSEAAETALVWLTRYAARTKAKVVLMRTVTTAVNSMTGAEAADEAKDYLQGMERELNYAGFPATIAVTRGTPAESIVRAAEGEDCDLILMATHAAVKVSRWRTGSVTARVLRLAQLPVLVVRSGMEFSHQGRVRRVIVPIDGSELAETVMPWAERLAHFHRARIVLLHQNEHLSKGPEAALDGDYRSLVTYLAVLRGQLWDRGFNTPVLLREGDAAQGILEVAGPGDMIAMTTRGNRGFSRWLFGSVAEKVIHDSTVPVLVYKGKPVNASWARHAQEAVLTHA